MMSQLNWEIGAEIELLAPIGSSRQDLAVAIATAHGGSVQRFFHPQSEPSELPGKPLFENLTLGFEVLDRHGNWIARCVDDLTLQDDLDKAKSPRPGWYRIVSDDARLLQLILQHSDPDAPLESVLNPIASLFGTQPRTGEGNMVRIADCSDRPIAVVAPLPGERERPCELIISPIVSHHLQQWEELLTIARQLGFTAPIEGATHLHFDATPLYSADVFANLVNLLWTHGANLRRLFGTNSHCRRLGVWSEDLIHLVQSSHFRSLPWAEAQKLLTPLHLTKYCDFNLKNIVHPTPIKPTFEVRIFPVWLHGQSVIEAAALIEAILRHVVSCAERKVEIPYTPPSEWHPLTMQKFLQNLPLAEPFYSLWQSRIDSQTIAFSQ
jgi:Putative amidoligase enzyme